jgi:hypothetical protein
MSTLKVSTISPLGTDATKTITIGSAGDTVAGAGANTPSFFAYLSSAQSISTNTITKAQCDTENWDTDSAYDNSSNYRFTVPSGKDGKYVFNAGASVSYLDDAEVLQLYLYKNGSSINAFPVREYSGAGDNQLTYSFSYTVSLVAGDYMEFYIRHNEGASQDAQPNFTYFSGYKLIGA